MKVPAAIATHIRVPGTPVRRWRDLLAFLVCGLLGLIALALLALHYVHLRADFPANTPWMDWAKYTDEGWYGDAAIRFFENAGHWFVPGDFNPAVALPVWPLLLGLLFRFTGVGIVPARALSVTIFCLAALVAALLVRRSLSDLYTHRRPTAPATAAPQLAAAGLLLLLAASPFLFAFSRMAILEPLLLLLGMLALLAASALPSPGGLFHRLRPAILVGILLPLMVLTKTTAVFLAPSILWLLWARSGYSLRRALPPVLAAVSIAITLWLLYFGLFVHPHFLADYRYLFSANAYTGITRDTARQILADTLHDGRWISPALFPAALAAALAGFLLPSLRRQPLFAALLLWIAGYATFLAYHDNLQPRYYLILAVPLLTLLPLTLGTLWIAAAGRPRLEQPLRTLTLLASAVLAVVTAYDARTTLHYVRTPAYTFISAAHQIQRIITADPTHSQLLLSISGSDISLMTGLHSICDDFGTLELDDRLELYKPGWYAAWNHVDDDKMDALAPLHLERVAAFPAYDDPDRNLLILYRLETAGEHRAGRRHRTRRSIPRRLLTRSGQQPSPTQLEH